MAWAALREPHLPVAVLDGPERDLRLIVNHGEGLVCEGRLEDRLRQLLRAPVVCTAVGCAQAGPWGVKPALSVIRRGL